MRDLTFPLNEEWYQVVTCGGCGGTYLDPRPSTPEELSRIYPPEYDSYVTEPSSFAQKLRRILWGTEIREILERSTPFTPVLEVGCATGELLAAIRRGGRPTLGVEASRVAAKVARERHALDVLEGDLVDLLDETRRKGPFSVVVMRFVLEHVSDPVGVVRAVRSVLTPGGTFIVSIPNPASLVASVFGKYWYGHDVPRHFHNFPPSALSTFLARAGFRVERVVHSAVPNDWIASLNYLLTYRGRGQWIRSRLTYLNPVALLVFLPLGLLGKALRASGRIRVIARPIAEA